MLRTGDILGYARVSTADQELSGQKDRLIQNGAVRVFEDVISGKTFNRPGLAALLDHARPNDTLAVIRLDRLGRSLKELLDTVDNLKARDVNLISLEEQGVPMLGVISGFDPFTGNLRFCWLSVAHTVMQVSWTSGQTYSRALRTDFIPAMCPCALLVLMSAYAGTG